MTRRWTWLEGGHHIPFPTGIALSCWERGLALVPSLGPWGAQMRQPQILWVANSLGLHLALHTGLRDICMSLRKCKWGKSTQSFLSVADPGWSGLRGGAGWAQVAADGLILRAALAGAGLVPLSVGFNEGYGLEETSEADFPIIPIIPTTILLVCCESSKPSREAPSLRPPRSQSGSAQFPSFPQPTFPFLII